MPDLIDITNEAKRLLGKPVIGISTVPLPTTSETLVEINDGTGRVTVIKVTDDEMSLGIADFSRLVLQPVLGGEE